MTLFFHTFQMAFFYVTGDFYFMPSMTFTTLIGIFIGSVIYDGDMKQMWRGIILLSSYVGMIMLVTFTRVLDDITPTVTQGKPLAGIVTILTVTLFYLIGMFLGVVITRRAHRK